MGTMRQFRGFGMARSALARTAPRGRAWWPWHRGWHAESASVSPTGNSPWCLPATELQDLVNLLRSPGVLRLIAELATGPSRYRDLRKNCPIGQRATEAAITRLEGFGLITCHRTPPQDWCALTASGQDLLEPLAGLAGWAREQRRDATLDRANLDPRE